MKLLLDSFTKDDLPEFTYILWILLGFAVIQILTIITSNISTYVSHIQSDILSDHMSKIVIAKAVETDLEYFDSDKYYDIYERAIAQSSSRPVLVLTALTQLVQSAISILAIFVLLLTLHWGVAFVLVVIALPIAFIRANYSSKLVALKLAHTQKERRAHYFRQILTQKADAKEVRIFGFGKYLLNKFLKIRKNVRQEKKIIYFNQMKSLGFAQSVEAISIVVALGVIAQKAIKDLLV